MVKKLLFGLALLTTTGAISQTRYIDDVFSSVDVTSDVYYATSIDRGGNDQDLHFDIYQPAGDNTEELRPLIVLCSEGSFLRNDKKDPYILDYANRMVKKGYVVASLEYRIGWVLPTPIISTPEDNARNIIPASWRAMQDYRAAIRFFKKSIQQGGNPYRIDPNLIIGGGFGAGAYLPINGETIDRSVEFTYDSMLKKNENTGEVEGTGPYIDTTLEGLGGIYDVSNGSAGYSSSINICLIYSGAMIDTAMFDEGTNPMAISVHGTDDQTTPFKSDVVYAQLGPTDLAEIIPVHGTYQINRILYGLGKNTYFKDIDSDGYPQPIIEDNQQGPLNMYERGLYPFKGEGYMPWDEENGESATYSLFMDTLVTYTAHRLAPFIEDFGGNSIENGPELVNSLKLFPSPATDKLSLSAANGIENVSVMNINGQIVLEADFKGVRSTTLDISELARGSYFIKVQTDKGKIVEKFMKE